MDPTLKKYAMVESIYRYWAENSVELFNKNQAIRPRMVGINFLPDGRLDCTSIDDAYVQQMLVTPGGEVELGRFARSLLVETELRSDMAKKGYKAVDIVVFIAQIEVRSNQAEGRGFSEAILIALHTPAGIRRGFCPIKGDQIPRASMGPLEPL